MHVLSAVIAGVLLLATAGKTRADPWEGSGEITVKAAYTRMAAPAGDGDGDGDGDASDGDASDGDASDGDGDGDGDGGASGEAGVLLYLFTDQEGKVFVLKDKRPLEIVDETSLGLPEDMALTAAFVDEDRGENYYYGEDFSFFETDSPFMRGRQSYGWFRRLLKDGGPDAAARKNGLGLVFKDCLAIGRFGAGLWGIPVPLSSVGLPCGVDAAWTEGSALVVLKGNQFWLWEGIAEVTGPFVFSDVYDLGDWTLAAGATD